MCVSVCSPFLSSLSLFVSHTIHAVYSLLLPFRLTSTVCGVKIQATTPDKTDELDRRPPDERFRWPDDGEVDMSPMRGGVR